MTFDPSSAVSVYLRVTPERISRFLELLGQGVHLEVQTGCSLQDLLCSQLGVAPEYLKNRIQTIFVNFRPVDAPEGTPVAGGATIALSAAMPGLVGAVMRKGGHYATLRREISQGASADCPQAARGVVKLKLFNLVAAELGSAFLGRGVGLRGEDWQDFLQRHGAEVAEGCVAAQIEGKAADLRDMAAMDWSGVSVLLRVVGGKAEGRADRSLNKSLE